MLTKIQHANPHFGPVYISNIDIADGFYCVWVNADDIPKLAMLFPTEQGGSHW